MSRAADYDTVSRRYDSRYEDQDWDWGGVQQSLLQFLGGKEPVEALEVGCGTGHWLGVVLARQPARLAGIDPSAGMLKRARQVATGAWLVQARAEDLPWATGSFDRVFCINAFHHFSEKAESLVEARRVLRSKGGLMLIGLDPHTGQDRWWIYDYFHTVLTLDKERFPPSGEILATMARAGFVRCETKEVQHFTRPIPARAAMERGLLDRSFTSQLMILSEQEYQDGVNRIRLQMDAVSATGADLVLATDLRFYATIGWAD
jgi:SAM-dependent methyltransferase